MNETDRAACERIHSAIQDEAPSVVDDEDEAKPAILTNWIAICEWVDERGEKMLSRWQSPGTPGWHVRGLLHEALFNWTGPWQAVEEDDEP